MVNLSLDGYVCGLLFLGCFHELREQFRCFLADLYEDEEYVFFHIMNQLVNRIAEHY